MTTDHALITFTTARLDEDEEIAKAVEDNSAPWPGQWEADGNHAVRTYNGHVLAYARTDNLRGGDFAPGLAAHIARHDPARALREVEAKRRIVDDYRITASAIDMITGPDIDTRGYKEMCAGRDALRASVLALAAIWAGHPDYQQAWRP